MSSYQFKVICNYVCLLIIIGGNVRAQQYINYNNNHFAHTQQFWQHQQLKKPAVQYIFASTPPPVSPAHAPPKPIANLNSRQNLDLTAQILEGSERFTFEMIYAIVGAIEKYELNFVLAPFSVWSLMLLLAEGAADQTLVQLKNTLHLPNDLLQVRTAYNGIQNNLQTNTTAIELAANHALFSNINYAIDNKYISTLSHTYRVEHVALSFQNASVAARTINDYISIRTQGRIENVVQPDDLIDVQLLLASSIFFRGQWKHPFNVNQTSMQPFYRENGDYLAHVPMMTQKNLYRYAAIASLGATFIELPYGNDNRFAMLLIYPNSTLAQLFELLSGTTATISRIHDELNRRNTNDDDDVVELTLPKFKIDSDLELATVLQHLGISDLFDQAKANLSKISRQQQQPTNLHVSRVFHKAIIDVDEIGTVAAAVSTASISNRIIPKIFIFDRPFAFIITDRLTNTLLFTGQIRNPLVSN